jgi:PAP2 superfamily
MGNSFVVRLPGRRGRGFSARREVAIGLGVYAVYLLVRAAAVTDAGRERAARNAARIVALERRLHLDVEPELQRIFIRYRRVMHVLNVSYATLNVGLTVAWLMRLFRQRHPDYHRARRAIALTTLGAQPFFLLLPTAPPRSLDHLVDTIAEISHVDLDSGLVVRLYHPLAAMPSIHVAYAVVTASEVVATTRSRFVRRIVPAYPPLVALVVFVTANHYVLDAVAGAALGAAGLRAARGLSGR